MLIWFTIDVMVESQRKPPFFMGSMLRGAFGLALKSTVCVNPSYKCEGCFSYGSCWYAKFYEEENSFHPYRFETYLKASNFDFSFSLYGEAVSSLPYVLSALRSTIESQGLGRDKETMRVRQMSIGNRIVFDGNRFLTLDDIHPNSLQIDKYCQNISIEFTMPLRIKENNRYATQTVSLHTLIHSIHSRLRELQGLPMERLGYRVEGEVIFEKFHYVKIERYSNRQRKTIPIGGIKGLMKITRIDRRSYELLKAGEIIGVGKQTVFGLGTYHIKESK